MTVQSIEAEPLSRTFIRKLAFYIRQDFNLLQEPYLPVVELIEHWLPEKLPDFVFDYAHPSILEDTHGYAKPDECYICIREDVYEGACNGVGRDRATVLHELGHIILHTSNRMRYRRSGGPVATYKDPEWQAKAFAGELLVAAHLIEEFNSISEVSRGFGVSEDAARIQLRAFERDNIIKGGQIRDLTSK